MLVCLCHCVTERELTQAVDLGLSTLEELRRDLGIGAGCGTCVEVALAVTVTLVVWPTPMIQTAHVA